MGHFWEVLEFLANTLVFFYFGIIISLRISNGHEEPVTPTGSHAGTGAVSLLNASDYGYAVLNWVLLNLIRLLTLIILKPVLNHFGDGFSWKDVIMATWAGLRGAVGLSLALILDLAARNDKASIDRRCDL
jgi:NhaP-type Na+/H+ or K+/H+ antiporter